MGSPLPTACFKPERTALSFLWFVVKRYGRPQYEGSLGNNPIFLDYGSIVLSSNPENPAQAKYRPEAQGAKLGAIGLPR